MKFFSWFEKPKNSVAFSFDHNHLRFVSLARTEQGITVASHGSESFHEDIIDATGIIKNEAHFVERLRKTIERIAFGGDEKQTPKATLVVPDRLAIMFHTHIAKSPEHQSDAVIVDHLKTYCEANMLLPFTEYICEYDIILETSFGYDVHVTLVPKPVANHFSRLFKQAGITLTHIETAHHAVAKACLNIPTGNGVVLVSFGKTWSTVAVLHGNHCVSQQVVPVGEDTVLTTIERYLKTDRAYAEKIIARHGLLQTHPDSGLLGELYQSIDPVCRSIDHQLIALGQIPYKTFGERFSTKHVLVYGTGTHIQGLVPLIGEKTGLQALLLDIWAGRKDQRAPLLDIHAKDILSYAEPLALALVYLK